MSVEVWYGEKPHHEAEQEALLELYQFLHPQQDRFVLLHNFFAGPSNQIDLVVLKRDGIFLAEFKRVWDPVIGGREGDWKAIRKDGSEVALNPDRPNPFKQVQRNYNRWKEWNQSHAGEISASLVRAAPPDWSEVFTYIVLYPDLPPGSEIDIGDWPVQASGLPSFLTALTVRSSERIDLAHQEMTRIPELLGLSRWQAVRPTKRLAGWHPVPFATLVARGHTLSAPLFRLDAVGQDAVAVGREPGNDLIINDATVSRRHAELLRHQGRWVVRDLGSTSGTFVSYTGDPNTESRVAGTEFALQNNSIVRFGPAAYTLLLQKGEGS
jgi:hypothetical protein